MPLLPDEVFVGKVIAELTQHFDVDFGHYRLATLTRRIANRMVCLSVENQDNYLEILKNSHSEPQALMDALTIRVSRFFRSPCVYETLLKEVLPSIVAQKKQQGGGDIRIWSAGCASGEEPYSLAILVDLLARKDKAKHSATILGTDISERGFEHAQKGLYSLKSLEWTPFGVVREYFKPLQDKFELDERIRKMVCFSRDDLTAFHNRSPVDSIFGSFDLVMCRNVMIYFDPLLQKRVFEKLFVNLSAGGYLVLGRSEQPPKGFLSKLKVVDSRARIYMNPQKTQDGDKETFNG